MLSIVSSVPSKYARAMLAGLLCAYFGGSKVDAQTAIYRGRVYTPQNYPHAMRCRSCGPSEMCYQIRQQWAAQTRVSTPVETPSTQVDYRLETRMETRRVKRCSGGRCWYETIQVPVTYRVPTTAKESTAAANLSTPPDAIKALARLLKLLGAQPGDVVLDLGCGRGDVLAMLADEGYTAVGVEIDYEIARIAHTKVFPRARVIRGDMHDVSLDVAKFIYLYHFPDDQAKLDIPNDVTVISYNHGIEGSEPIKYGGFTFFVRR